MSPSAGRKERDRKQQPSDFRAEKHHHHHHHSITSPKGDRDRGDSPKKDLKSDKKAQKKQSSASQSQTYSHSGSADEAAPTPKSGKKKEAVDNRAEESGRHKKRKGTAGQSLKPAKKEPAEAEKKKKEKDKEPSSSSTDNKGEADDRKKRKKDNK